MAKDADILTATKAAAYLRLNTSTLYRLAKKGKIPAIRIGTRLRFSRAALEKYVRAQIAKQKR